MVKDLEKFRIKVQTREQQRVRQFFTIVAINFVVLFYVQ
jgi:hypothetical protein